LYSDNVIYYVRHGFLERFGRNILWWLVVILSVAAVLLFEIVVRTAKTAWKPTDVEVFQMLEKEPDVRRRFEESSGGWLYQGWQRDGDAPSLRADQVFGGEGVKTEQEKREKEVGELLARPRVMTIGKEGVEEREQAVVVEEQNIPMEEEKAQEMLNRGFGMVRK
jgi:phospholipid-translocating ATPase